MPIFSFKKWKQDTGKDSVKFFLQDLNSAIDIKYWDGTSKQFMLDNPSGTFRKTVQYMRNVVIDGILMTMPLRTSAETQLRQAVENIKNMGLNPLQYGYALKKEGIGLDTRYTLTVGEPGTQPQTTKKEDIKLVLPIQDVPVKMNLQGLSKEEEGFIQQFKQLVPKEKQTLDYFKGAWNATASAGQISIIKEERMEELFKSIG